MKVVKYLKIYHLCKINSTNFKFLDGYFNNIQVRSYVIAGYNCFENKYVVFCGSVSYMVVGVRRMNEVGTKQWYVARTRNAQALHVRTLLQKYQVDYFIPTILKVVECNKHRITKEVPLISNLVFIHTTKNHACALANEMGVPVFYVIDKSTHSLMVVPEKQMKYFMQVVDLSPNSICLSELPFTKGGKVKVIKGDFAGIEGEMLGMATRTYVLIRIGDVMAAKIKVPKGYLVAVE